MVSMGYSTHCYKQIHWWLARLSFFFFFFSRWANASTTSFAMETSNTCATTPASSVSAPTPPCSWRAQPRPRLQPRPKPRPLSAAQRQQRRRRAERPAKQQQAPPLWRPKGPPSKATRPAWSASSWTSTLRWAAIQLSADFRAGVRFIVCMGWFFCLFLFIFFLQNCAELWALFNQGDLLEPCKPIHYIIPVFFPAHTTVAFTKETIGDLAYPYVYSQHAWLQTLPRDCWNLAHPSVFPQHAELWALPSRLLEQTVGIWVYASCLPPRCRVPMGPFSQLYHVRLLHRH